MAVPTRRTGVTRKRTRRQHLGLTAVATVTCPNCGAQVRSHHVCPSCGYYNGKKVIDVKEAE